MTGEQNKRYAHVEEGADDGKPSDLRGSGYDGGFYRCVFKVHLGVYVIVHDERNCGCVYTVVHFLSYRTKRILHTLRLDNAGPRGVLFLPGGRMYLANGDGIDYYGPRKDGMMSASR